MSTSGVLAVERTADVVESAEQRSTQVAAYQAEITREREALELTDAPTTIDRERVPGWWPG